MRERMPLVEIAINARRISLAEPRNRRRGLEYLDEAVRGDKIRSEDRDAIAALVDGARHGDMRDINVVAANARKQDAMNGSSTR